MSKSKIKFIYILLVFVFLILTSSCNNNSTGSIMQTNSKVSKNVEKPRKTFLIGMSQCNLGEPWRVEMNNQIEQAVKKYPDLKVVFSDAGQDNSKQIADIEYFIQQKIDLLITSPNEAKPLTAVIKKAFESGIPVILLDRKIYGDTYTQFIGADNVMIGRGLGEFVSKYLGEVGGNIVEIKGLEGTSGQSERHIGFLQGIKNNPKAKIIASQNADWLREKAITVMEDILQTNRKIDVVFAQNDPMAEGAYTAAKNAGREKDMLFIGADALPTLDGGIKSVIDGRISVTYTYPTGGKEAIDNAYKLLVKGEELQKNVILSTMEINKYNAKKIYKEIVGK